MKSGLRTLLSLALVGGLHHVVSAAPAEAAFNATLDRDLAAIAADPAFGIASMSVLAIRDGKVVYTQQFGRRIIDVNNGPGDQPVKPETMFRIASISKMMTTLAAMKLVEEGKLALDADVGGYLGFPLRNPHFPDQVITLRHLLSHTASLRDDGGYSWSSDIALKDILVPGAKLYGKGASWAANAPAGQYFTYCNLDWGLIGTIMESVTGERFDLLMKRLLLTPMGVHGGYNPSAFSPEELGNLATLYRKRTVDTEIWNANGPWIAQVDDYSVRPAAPPVNFASYVIGANATPFSPTGGLRISAPDMGKIMLMLINGGRADGKQIIEPATLALMFARQWTYNGKDNGDTLHGLLNAWGLGNQQFLDLPGQQLVEGGGFPAVGHLGDAYGLYSLFAVNLARRNGVVVLVGGTSTDPELQRGHYSALTRLQEQAVNALYRRAILGQIN